MNTIHGVIIVFAWVLMALSASAFLLVFGRPGKYMDRTMAWHLWLTTALAGLEPLGLLLAGLSLWPALIIYTGSVGVMVWRFVLLVRERETPPKGGGEQRAK